MTNKIDHEKILSTVIKYIHGEINLNDAENYLDYLGFEKESVTKVLTSTERSNIVSINQKKEGKHEKNN